MNALIQENATTTTSTNETIARQLRWRYATKKFDPARKVSDTDFETVKQALALAPSAYGLSPWRFVVVNDPAVRAHLRAAAYGQAQLTDASHVVVLAGRKGLDAAYVDKFIARVAEVRGATPTALKGYRDMMVGFVDGLRTAKGDAAVDAWAARQVYIALGQGLETAALLGLDACPMEGFDAAKFDQILGLDAQGYGALAILAVGYRAADDKYAEAPKVRLAEQDVLVEV
ncbi:MAG TPA: NAD(P)H-dependent oxidoreductase [Tepidisphaeraceae bacterium]|nr:NAD(P)H-dependent oxidoreductase [Tepidisphaeraceae bacterium]